MVKNLLLAIFYISGIIAVSYVSDGDKVFGLTCVILWTLVILFITMEINKEADDNASR